MTRLRWLFIPLAMVLAAPAMAASSKRIEHTIDAANLNHIDFEISVAELDIEVYDGTTVELDVMLRAQRSWFLFGRRDIEDVELRIDTNGDSLEVILDENNIEQEWRVRLPVHLAVSMELGVGDVDINEFANDLRLELGVGSVQVDVVDMDFGTIHLQTGVGDSSIRGFDGGVDNERSIVGADSYYEGNGEYEIEIEVGVGDARVRRRP
ncbi:MAG: hypothetical protein RL120_15780 [Gammaproteobacteria bacterium]